MGVADWEKIYQFNSSFGKCIKRKKIFSETSELFAFHKDRSSIVFSQWCNAIELLDWPAGYQGPLSVYISLSVKILLYENL